MNTYDLGTLHEIEDLRTIWEHEAHDFTPWLAQEENIALLSTAIGIDIKVVETESSVGRFNLDVLATEPGSNRTIIIENQLTKTDHDHLGKLLTYASGKDSSIIIWITKKAEEEHRAAIEWLNNHTDEAIAFFLCEIKLYQINDSKIAPKFEIIEKPNNWIKAVKNTGSSIYYKYWKAFIDYALEDTNFFQDFSHRNPSFDPSFNLSFKNGSLGSNRCFTLTVTPSKNLIKICLRLDAKDGLYDSLYSEKKSIEDHLGLALEWNKEINNDKDNKSITIVASHSFHSFLESDWIELFNWYISTALKLKKILQPYIVQTSSV